MKTIIFIIFSIITINAQYSDTTSIITMTFNESMSIEGLLDTNNYSVIDETGKSWKIHRIGIVREIDGQVISDTSIIAIITERLAYNKQYRITANNVKDKAGNTIANYNWALIYFQGYKPSIKTPTVNIRK